MDSDLTALDDSISDFSDLSEPNDEPSVFEDAVRTDDIPMLGDQAEPVRILAPAAVMAASRRRSLEGTEKRFAFLSHTGQKAKKPLIALLCLASLATPVILAWQFRSGDESENARIESDGTSLPSNSTIAPDSGRDPNGPDTSGREQSPDGDSPKGTSEDVDDKPAPLGDSVAPRLPTTERSSTTNASTTTLRPTTTQTPTTPPPTTQPATTQTPTTQPPTTQPPTTQPPTTQPATTQPPTTQPPTTQPPTTQPPTTQPPTTQPPTTQAPFGPNLGGFTLVAASGGQNLGDLGNGSVISLSQIGQPISIRVAASEETNSVRYAVNGSVVKLETQRPFSIQGDDGGNYYGAWSVSPGDYTITATPYWSSSGWGIGGPPLSITITVTD